MEGFVSKTIVPVKFGKGVESPESTTSIKKARYFLKFEKENCSTWVKDLGSWERNEGIVQMHN
jgi:hypothetical protein